MRFPVSRFSILATVLFLLAAVPGTRALAAAKPTLPGGLTAAQRAIVRRLSIPVVVPASIPAGFGRPQLEADPDVDPGYYRIVYRRAGGESLIFSGRQAKGAPQPTDTPRRGLFQRIGQIVSHVARPQPTAVAMNAGHAGEQEEHVTGVSADSQLIGPATFVSERGCYTGTAQRDKAKLAAAEFTVEGCHLRNVDTLTRAYRSLVRV